MKTNLSLHSIDKIINEEIKDHIENTNLLYNLITDISILSQKIIEVLKNDNKLFICGNGGSAADSQHFSSELIGRFEKSRKSIPAISLTTDTSSLTSISNDFGFEDIFSRQIEGLGKQGDMLIAISTSGKSKNIIKAVKTSKKMRLETVALLGRDGGDLFREVDHSIIINTKRTCRIQEMHGLIIHIICGLIENHIV